MIENFPKVLALDFGTQRIGVAISYGSLAEPLTVLANTPQVMTQIIRLLDEHKVTQIVVGLSENQMAELTQKFVEELKKRTSLPIEFMDETLSSATVQEKLYAAGKRDLRQKGPIDHFAAAEVLQSYLDEVLE
jgi:putative Holliday junction resolvase